MREEQRSYFLALSRAENIGKAATQLHISRQGLSKSIAALEQEVGVPLFKRTRRGVSLTQAGELLKECLDAQDELWDGFLNQIQSLRPATTQTIRIGLRDIYCNYQDKRFIYSFRRTHPDISIETRDNDFDEIWDLLQEGSLDLAFSITPPASYELCEILSGTNYASVLMSEDNPLSACNAISFDSGLRDATVIQPSAYLRRLYQPYYTTRGIRFKYANVDRNSMRAIIASCNDVFIGTDTVVRGLLAEGLTMRPLVDNPLNERAMSSCILFKRDINGPAREFLLNLCAQWGLLNDCRQLLEMESSGDTEGDSFKMS